MALTADAWHKGGRAVTLVTDAFVTRIDTSTSGSTVTAAGVTWRDNPSGTVNSETARVIVMAGGCTENPRLWLNSGLPNPNDWVGRGYTDHHVDFLTGLFPFYTGSSKGSGSSARCDFPGRGGLENVGLPPAIQAFGATFSDAGMIGLYDNGTQQTTAGADHLGRAVGNELRGLLEHGIDRLLNVLVIADDDVEPQNRVTLSTQLPSDEHGSVPRVAIDGRARSARTRSNREFLAGRAVELLRKAGATKVYRWGFPPLILHVQSTMRMGTDAGTSVLDSNAEARFVKRLFIADNSALANGLGGPNPTLTAQALATRTAEKIFTKYFGGKHWVGTESPVASTDPRVTAAVRARGL